MSDLLDRLNKLKDDSGMNAKQLTTALGLSSTSFTDWNKGKGSPSLDAVIKFAEYFNVSTDFLILVGTNLSLPLLNWIFPARLIKSSWQNTTAYRLNSRTSS